MSPGSPADAGIRSAKNSTAVTTVSRQDGNEWMQTELMAYFRNVKGVFLQIYEKIPVHSAAGCFSAAEWIPRHVNDAVQER